MKEHQLFHPPNHNHELTMNEADQEQSDAAKKLKQKLCNRESYLRNREKVLERSRARYLANAKKRNEQCRAWTAANRERDTARRHAWEEANREKLKEQARAKYLKNRNKILAQSKAWALANPEKRKQTALAYRLADPEKVRERNKAWLKANRGQANEYLRIKRATDPQFKIKANLRTRLYLAIRKQNTRKESGMTKLLGCSVDELKKSLESKFKRGMRWENYGSFWHIDHIIPLASFDLSDPNQLAIACHHTNLRPLKASENITKGDKITHPQMSLLLSA